MHRKNPAVFRANGPTPTALAIAQLSNRVSDLEVALTEIIAEVQDDGSLIKCAMIADAALKKCDKHLK